MKEDNYVETVLTEVIDFFQTQYPEYHFILIDCQRRTNLIILLCQESDILAGQYAAMFNQSHSPDYIIKSGNWGNRVSYISSVKYELLYSTF